MMKYISRKYCHGKQLFGKTVYNRILFIQTTFCKMLISLNEGPKCLTRLIPISKLKSALLFEQTVLTVLAIISILADVKAIIFDVNRLNQTFFKKRLTLFKKAY